MARENHVLRGVLDLLIMKELSLLLPVLAAIMACSGDGGAGPEDADAPDEFLKCWRSHIHPGQAQFIRVVDRF